MNFVGTLNTLFNEVEPRTLRSVKTITEELKKSIKTEEDIVQFAQFKYLLGFGADNFVYEMYVGHTVDDNLFNKLDSIITEFDKNQISPQIYSYYIYCTLQALKVKTDRVMWFDPFENKLDNDSREMQKTFGVGLSKETLDDFEISNLVIKAYTANRSYLTIPNEIVGVDEKVFSNNNKLEFVTLPNSLTTLPNGMFSGCVNMKTLLMSSETKVIPHQFCKGNQNLSLVIANGVREIKPKAFEGTSISNIGFLGNKQLEVIGAEAFKDCEELRKIDAVNAAEIHPLAFTNCVNVSHMTLTVTSSIISNDYKLYSFFENNISEFKKYRELTELRITVPNGEIPASFFEDCFTVQRIEIIGNVSKIGARAFKNCHNLKELIIDFSGNVLEEEVFYGCRNLNNLPVFDSVDVISNSVFKGCNSVQALHFNTITNLGRNVFEDCSNLTDIKFNYNGDLLPEYSFSGCYSLRKYDFLKKVKRIGSFALAKMTFDDKFEIPSSIKGISTNAFDNCVFEGVLTIPKGCKINTAAFSNINTISTIVYSNLEITDLNNDSILPYMIFEESLDSFNSNFKQLSTVKIDAPKIQSSAFKGWSNIDSVVVKGDFVEVPISCFENCTSLTSVRIDANKFQIKSNAFANCFNLKRLKTNQTKIEFNNDNVIDLSLATKVEPNAFTKCSGIQEVCVTITEQSVAQRFKLHTLFEDIKMDIEGKYDSLRTAILNLETNVVPDYFFDACQNISTIKIIGELEELSEGFFRDCTKLSELEMDYVGTIIPKECFKNCVSLKTLTPLAYVDFIDKEAFFGCKSLKNIKIDCEVNRLGASAFEDCISLEKVEMAFVGDLLPSRCFVNCNSITNFRFLNNISKIQSYALSNISFPSDFVVPTKLDYIESYAFANSTFADVLSLPAAKIINNLAFHNTKGFKKIEFNNLKLCDAQKVEILPYKIFTDVLKDFNFKYSDVDAIVIKTNNIIDEAFKDWEFIKNVGISPAVKILPNSCFEGCLSLERIRLPYYDIALGNKVFNDCENLTDVSFTEFDTKTEVNNFVPLGTYHNCTKLENISISIDETVLANGLKLHSFFENTLEEFNVKYKKLTSIKIRSRVQEIPESFFEGCINLEKIVIFDEIKVLNRNVFAHCSNLQQLKMKFIGEIIPIACFQDCERLPIITNLKSVKIIEERAFEKCYSITALQFRTPIESLGARAFDNCKNLEKINMYYVGEFLPASCFSNCEALLVTPHLLNLKFADNSAFEGCINLDCVHINAIEGASVTNVFASSKRISKINFTSEHIPARFFSNLRGVEELVFTKRILSIGESAFEGVRDLQTIKNIEFVETIGAYAFANSDIEVMKLTARTKFIGVGVFAGCEKLTSVELPIRFKYAGVLFDSLNQNSTKKVTHITGAYDKEYYIPESLEEINIVEGAITRAMFSGMNINVNVLCDVVDIAPYAFYGCRNIVFSNPSKIKTVGEYAFAWSSVKDVVLDNVKKIEKYSFAFSRINSIEIGDKLTDFHNTTLIETVLGKLRISETESFLTLNEMLVDIKKGSIVHVNNVKGEIIIPDQVHTLNSDTFVNCNEITKVDTNKVKIISTNAFVNCPKLESVVTTHSIETIEEAIFKDCPSINDLVLYFLGKSRTEAKPISYLFENLNDGYSFNRLNIVDGEFSEEPFSSCSSIELLDLQKVNLVSLPKGLLKNLKINEFVLPDNTATFEEYAFDNTFISTVSNKNNKDVSIVDGCIKADNKLIYCFYDNVNSIVVEKNIKEVYPGAFQVCNVINHLEILNDKVKINDAFKSVLVIKTLTLGKINDILSNVISNALHSVEVLNYQGVDFVEGFLNGLGDLTVLNVLNIKTLDTNAVSGSLNKIEISTVNIGSNLDVLDPELLRLFDIDNINVVQNQFFQSHDNMLIDIRNNSIVYAANEINSDIVIDFNVQSIAQSAFKGCKKLVSFNSGKIQEIGDEAFFGCSRLSDIVITNMCNSIGLDIIKKCEKLEKVSVPFVGKTKDDTEKISYLLELERNAPVDILNITNQVVIDGTFAYAKNINKIVFSDVTTTINANSFNSCLDIKEVSIPKSVSKVGEFIFFNCKKKTVVYVHSKQLTEQWSKDWRKVKDSNFFSNVKVVYAVDEA